MVCCVNARRFVQAALLLAVCLCLPACGNSKVNKANYDKIQVGMTMDDVEDILGKGTKESDGTGTPAQFGVHVESGSTRGQEPYLWESGDKKIRVYFRNDKVVRKHPEGL